MSNKKTGAEELRAIVSWIDNTRESVLDQYTAEELIKLWRMFVLSDWDFYLDQWTPTQRALALQGVVPKWDDQERPIIEDAPTLQS
jgi:hypothetical protein